MKKRKLIFLIFIIALFVGVISRIVYVNITATPTPKVYYPMGETIEYTDDFLFKPMDSLIGYTVNIKSASLMTSQDYMEKYGIKQEDLPLLEYEVASYVIDLEVEFSNINSENPINPSTYTLLSDFDGLVIEQNLFGALYEQPQIIQGIALEKGETKTYHLPYCYNGSENIPFFDVYDYLKNSDYLYVLSQYPTERYITVTVTDKT